MSFPLTTWSLGFGRRTTGRGLAGTSTATVTRTGSGGCARFIVGRFTLSCAPALRTSSQSEAFRIALQMLGDLTGFGIGYFDFDESRGYVRTATEVSSDNSALMRNIRRNENALRSPISDIAGAIMCVSRRYGESIPDEGVMRVMFDDSIIQDTAAEKEQDMREVGVTMAAWGVPCQVVWRGREDG